MRNTIIMGVDIGQKRDPTALCVAEVENRRRNARVVHHFVVRHLERLPPATPFPAVAKRLSEVALSIRQRNDHLTCVYVDATGIGQPIIDLLNEETVHLGSIHPVYFTHGDRRTGEGYEILLGKAYLVSRLQMLLQTGRLHLPRTEQAAQLAQELLDYEIQVEKDANDHYGAFRVGSHDDLVTALGLAVHHVDTGCWVI